MSVINKITGTFQRNPKIKFTQGAIETLVADCPELFSINSFTLFITINPNPRTLIKVSRLFTEANHRHVISIAYGRATQKEQYDYCLKIFMKNFIEFCADPTAVGTWELTQAGNVHLHILLKDRRISNDMQLELFRRDVANCEEVMRHMGKDGRDWMNNIVKLTKTSKEIIQYMDKYFHNALLVQYRGLLNFYLNVNYKGIVRHGKEDCQKEETLQKETKD